MRTLRVFIHMINSIMAKIRRYCLISLIFCTLFFTTACTISPWVKPYERQNLADPIMAFDRDPVAVRYLNHVYEAREGMRGAEGSSGGGCGCN